MSCPEDKIIFDAERGEYICTETGEVLEERAIVNDYYHNQNFSKTEFLQKREKSEIEKRSLSISITKLTEYILSRLDENERELFFTITEKINKIDAIMLVAIYEYILIKHGELDTSLRESLNIGDHAIRQRKKIIRQILEERDNVADYIKKHYGEEALRFYEKLKEKNIISGYKSKKRLEIFLRYYNDSKKRREIEKEIERKNTLDEITTFIILADLI